MNTDDLIKQIVYEKNFRSNMKNEEMQYYINILMQCKELNDSKINIGNNKCKINDMLINKVDINKIMFNGSIAIGSIENRFIDGEIYINSNSIVVDMHVVRACVNGIGEYTVCDEFKIVKEKLSRSSFYNFDMKFETKNINNVEMERILK